VLLAIMKEEKTPTKIIPTNKTPAMLVLKGNLTNSKGLYRSNFTPVLGFLRGFKAELMGCDM
jgi:hypothetical protein